jgi:hypothetical protein
LRAALPILLDLCVDLNLVRIERCFGGGGEASRAAFRNVNLTSFWCKNSQTSPTNEQTENPMNTGFGSRLTAILVAVTMSVAYLTADLEAVTSIFSDPDKFVKADPFPYFICTL